MFSFPHSFYKKRKENPPSQRGCYFSCCYLLCDWSSIQHSSLLPVFSLAFAPSLQTELIVSGHLRMSHWGKPFSTVTFFNIHNTNHSLCSGRFTALLIPKAQTSFASSFQIPAADDWNHLLSSIIPFSFFNKYKIIG